MRDKDRDRDRQRQTEIPRYRDRDRDRDRETETDRETEIQGQGQGQRQRETERERQRERESERGGIERQRDRESLSKHCHILLSHTFSLDYPDSVRWQYFSAPQLRLVVLSTADVATRPALRQNREETLIGHGAEFKITN